MAAAIDSTSPSDRSLPDRRQNASHFSRRLIPSLSSGIPNNVDVDTSRRQLVSCRGTPRNTLDDVGREWVKLENKGAGSYLESDESCSRALNLFK